MPDIPSMAGRGEAELRAEIARLNKVIQALMNRVEHSTNAQGTDYNLFQTAVMLEERVRDRTEELEAALRENEKITRALRESELKFRGLVNQSLVGIAIVEDGKFTFGNQKLLEMFGYSEEEGRRLGPVDIAVEGERELVAENIRKRLTGEAARVDYMFHGLRKSGDVIDVEVHGNVMAIGGKPALISVIMDVTERNRIEREVRALQERLREQAIRDALTGLYNRRYLEETLGRELILARREGRALSVIMADLDHFKDVNDTHGHLAGDEVLRVFGALMQRHARASDICCRYGGEEFLLVLPGMAQENAAARAEQLRSAMATTPVAFGPLAISVTASFGIASFRHHGQTSDELIGAADAALYAAKAMGRNQISVSPGGYLRNDSL